MGRKQLSHGIQTGKKQTKKQQLTLKKLIQRMHMHLLVRDNTWAGPWAAPSNPRAGPRNCRAGPYKTRVSWASLPCDGSGRAETFENMMDRAGPDRELFEKVMG